VIHVGEPYRDSFGKGMRLEQLLLEGRVGLDLLEADVGQLEPDEDGSGQGPAAQARRNRIGPRFPENERSQGRGINDVRGHHGPPARNGPIRQGS